MVTQHRLNRLNRLEARHAKNHAVKPEEGLPSRLNVVLLVLIAYHLGGLQQAEPLPSALARALGYDTACMVGGRPQVDVYLFSQPDFQARYEEAFFRLLAFAKTDLGVEGEEVNPALRALFNAIPKWCGEHPAIAGFEADKIFGDVPNVPPGGSSKRSALTLNLDNDIPQD